MRSNENGRPAGDGTDRIGNELPNHTASHGGGDVHKLLSGLEGVKPAGDRRWYARCPAHDDRSPSLSVRLTDEGKVLIYCFAGCESESVLDALGLTWRDLYSDRWQAARHAATSRRKIPTLERILREADPMEHERLILRIAAADLRAGKDTIG
ncbi:MAG: DNA primase [Pseudomonadota bacterium]|nr:DNA primase [Pseudomonadota bacterium]